MTFYPSLAAAIFNAEFVGSVLCNGTSWVSPKYPLYLFEYHGIFESWCLIMSHVVCYRFCCPICSKSTQNMSRVWHQLDQEVYLTPMPEEYRQKKVHFGSLLSHWLWMPQRFGYTHHTTRRLIIFFSVQVWILCNDCGTTSDVYYHVIGHKCLGCGSYNTRSTCPPSQSRRAEPRPSVGMLPGAIESSITPNSAQPGRTLAAEMSAE